MSALDRLSALLESAQPSIDLVADGDLPPDNDHALYLDLLTAGHFEFTGPNGVRRLSSPALIVSRQREGLLPRITEGQRSVCLRVALDGPAGHLLAAEFPEPLGIEIAEADQTFVQIIQLISQEANAPRCGHPALLRRAGDILFIALLRHLVEHPRHGGSLFHGLADKRIARALVAMHSHPEQRWTLQELADEAGMSRTAFANAFRDTLRQTPGNYLTRLRLALARRQIEQGRSLKEAARGCGYGSAAALSRALARAGARAG